MDRDTVPLVTGEPPSSGKALWSMILGIASFFCWVFTGIPAIILGALALGDIKKSGGRVGGQGMAIAGIVTGSISTVMTLVIVPLMLALLLPAIQAAREAARRNMSMSQMKEISYGLHNFESTHHFLPAPGGGPQASQLSWRVHILPYLNDPAAAELHKEFHLEEPWDSPHNATLISKMPEVYFIASSADVPPGKTTYLLATGPGTAFPHGKATPAMSDFTDGTGNTIVFVEADAAQAVEWTKPDDWHFNPNDPLQGLGHLRGYGFLVGTADGAVHFVTLDTQPNVIKAMLTPAGNEPVNLR